jgi:pimeloyl-ACP methyl ester carboxylesterase
MSPRAKVLLIVAVAVLTLLAMLLPAIPSPAQTRMVQDSTLNNLVHAPGYVTAAPGTLGAVVERGKGPIDMVLVSGFGVGASAFEGFMKRNASRYHMLAVTLAGFEGSAAPPMPDSGTSYGAQTWTSEADDALVKLIRDRKLKRPVLVGHFLNGTQVAMRVAMEHPDLVRAVVLLSGTPRYEPAKPLRFWPQNLTLDQKVKAVDQYLAPRWFKTVTRETWVKGNYTAADYSVDSTLGARFANRANDPPLPVLIRYLCEFHASDMWPVLDSLRCPLLVVMPHFTPKLRADSTKTYLDSYFEYSWRGKLDGRPKTESLLVDDAGILVMDDQPAIVDRKVAAFLAGLVK